MQTASADDTLGARHVMHGLDKAQRIGGEGGGIVDADAARVLINWNLVEDANEGRWDWQIRTVVYHTMSHEQEGARSLPGTREM